MSTSHVQVDADGAYICATDPILAILYTHFMLYVVGRKTLIPADSDFVLLNRPGLLYMNL
jgi:hypothetical protein